MDREKVIGHLLIIRTWNEVGKAYAHDEMDKREKAKTVEWIDETLELLKEQEPKSGHWIFESQYCEAWSHTCSECGKRMTTAVNTFANWCWNCGAKMERR